MTTKQEYMSRLKKINVDRFPKFSTLKGFGTKYVHQEIPENSWYYYVLTSSIYWKQKVREHVGTYYETDATWSIEIEIDKETGIAKDVTFRKWRHLKSEIPDEVTNYSLYALEKFYKTPLWKWGAGIVGLLVILSLFRKPRAKKKK